MKTRSGTKYNDFSLTEFSLNKIKKLSNNNKKMQKKINTYVQIASNFNDTNNKICDMLLRLPSVLENGSIVKSNYY